MVVLSIPDWGVTPFAPDGQRERIAKEIDSFNSVVADQSAAKGVRFVDVTPGSRLARNDASLLASDGLHPSGLMYAGWADLVLPEALLALEVGASPQP